jgi:hypothetical protein
LIIRREVFNKEFKTTETTNYTYNGKILKTKNNITFVNSNGEFMTFKAPDETITTSSSSNLYKYRGFVDFEQDLVYEYITIAEDYDLILYGDNRAATIDQNNYRYFYDENKNPFNNIIGMGYLLNNDNRLNRILHLLNGTCKKNINKIEAYSFLTFWGNPTSVTVNNPVYTYDRVYTYNELSYPTEISEKVYKKILYRLFDGGLELKDFENIYKGFTMGQSDIKECEDVLKSLRPIVKKHFTEHQTIALKEFQANLESIPSQLDQFLSI